MNDIESIDYYVIGGMPVVMATMKDGNVKRVFDKQAIALQSLITTFNNSSSELERNNAKLLIEAKLIS